MSELGLWREKAGRLPEPGASPAPIQGQLWRLLAHRAALYTGTDSSSLRLETAQELFDSVCFTLRLNWAQAEKSGVLVAYHELEQAYHLGMQRIGRQCVYGRRLWEKVSHMQPPLKSQSLQDTLQEIGQFWRRYDSHFFAHRIPCQIDYQLSWPVDEALKGVDYINCYLERLWVENDFLRRFPEKEMIPVLRALCPDYQGLLVNLYEPVAVNAVGRAMLGEDCTVLSISADQLGTLFRLLDPLPKAALEKQLRAGARIAAEQLRIPRGMAVQYLAHLAEGLAPRIMGVRDFGGLEGIFLSPKTEWA